MTSANALIWFSSAFAVSLGRGFESTWEQLKEIIEDFFITTENEEDKQTFQRDLHDSQDLTFYLDIQNNKYTEDFSSFLDKPGDCLNRLFHKPDKFSSGQFNYTSDVLNVSNVSFKKLFKYSPITDACFMYNYHPKNDYEILVISAKNKNEGWAWLMSSKPSNNDSSNRDLFYRELVLEKKDNKWIVTLGQGGEIKVFKYKKFEKSNSYAKDSKWYNTHLKVPCDQQACLENNWKSLNLYWKPNNNSNEKLSQLLSNTEDQIIRLNKKKEKQIYKNGNRKSIYWKEKWHNNLGEQKSKPLIKLKLKNITELNGEWRDLYDICENVKNNPKPSKDQQTYCFYKKNISTAVNQQPRGKVTVPNQKNQTLQQNKVTAQPIPKNNEVNALSEKPTANPKGGGDNKKTETQQPPSPKNIHYPISPKQKEKPDSVDTHVSIDEEVLTKQKQENEILNGDGISEKKQKLSESSTTLDTERESSETVNVNGAENNQGRSLKTEENQTKGSKKETIVNNDQGIETLEEVKGSETSNLVEGQVKNAQPSKKENPFNYTLDFQEDDFYKSFNNPGDCITKLFKDIKQDPIFKEKEIDYTTVLSIAAKDVFRGNAKDDKIDSACYTYHFRSTEGTPQRLEIAVKGEKEGWVWMMGSKPKWKGTQYLKVWYREFILKKNDDGWKAIIGHEGEILDSYAPDSLAMSVASGFDAYMDHKWYDVKNLRECIGSTKDCNSLSEKSLNLYWKPNNRSQREMVQLSLNTGDQIIRWSGKKWRMYSSSYDDKQKEVYHRKRIYHNGKWHYKIDSIRQKPLINLNDNDVAKTKGSWENIYTLCNDPSQKRTDPTNYNIYCK